MSNEVIPIVFVSYAWEDAEVSTALAEHLRAQEFEVFRDRDRLRHDDPVQEVIGRNAGNCDAALLLLSKAALESAWVAHEVTLLTARRDDIEICTVLLDGLSRDRVATEAGPFANLAGRIYSEVGSDAVLADPGRALAEIMERLVDYRRRLQTDIPSHEARIAIERWVGRDPVFLRQLATELDVDLLGINDVARQRRRLATAILKAPLTTLCDLARLFASSGLELLRAIGPYGWVPAEGAIALRAALRSSQGELAFLIAFARNHTPSMYLRCASKLVPQKWKLLCCDDLELTPEDTAAGTAAEARRADVLAKLRAGIRAALEDHLGLSARREIGFPITDGDLVRELRQRKQEDACVLVQLPAHVERYDRELVTMLGELSANLGGVAWLVVARPQSSRPTWLGDATELRADPPGEGDAFRLYGNALSDLGLPIDFSQLTPP